MEILYDDIARELASQSGFGVIAPAEKKLEKIRENLARPPKPEMGDVTLGCFKLAKDLGMKPNELATKLVGAGLVPPAKDALVQSMQAAGPYVNLRLNRNAAFQAALRAVEEASQGEQANDWRFGNSGEGAGKTLVVDLSSPNIAKPLAVHHLRSTMIGYSIKKIREAQGWRVVGVNHLGDWGTAFGKLIAGLKMEHPDVKRYLNGELSGATNPVDGLGIIHMNGAYRRFNEQAGTNADLEQQGKDMFAAMERGIRLFYEGIRGDPSFQGQSLDQWAYFLWKHILYKSFDAFEKAYQRLGVRFVEWEYIGAKDAEAARTFQREKYPERWRDHEIAAKIFKENATQFYQSYCVYIGESFYLRQPLDEEKFWETDLCTGLIAQWRDDPTNRSVEESDHALVIFTHGKKSPPVMLLKSDGATSYHARDMAAACYRERTFGASEMAYVVGGEQKLHFDQLFKALKMLGYEWADQCTHVDFGLMLFKNDKGAWEKTSTRRGTAIMLEDLLDEAVKAVREIIQQKNPELWADIQSGKVDPQTADKIGVSAVVFNDLKNGRRNNVKFDWDAVLDFEGESGPYMLYQYVRMGSVLEKYREKFGAPDFSAGDAALLNLDDEWAIIRQIADFPLAVARASREYEPSIVARALIELAGATSTWWTATKDTRIVGQDAALSLARVRLVNAIRKVLGRGLTLLGMQLVERM